MSNLIPEVRADINGKLVTRHVKSGDAAATGKTLPAPVLKAEGVRQRKRPAFKPTERQQMQVSYGVPMDTSEDDDWGRIGNRPTSPELLAVPITERQKELFIGDYHRFQTNELEYYSVLSVARPWDAINLLHRGIRSADEAREFLSQHGLDHLAGDYSDYVDEFLRKRFSPNLAASFMDKIIDYGAEPKNAVEWVEACAFKSIMDKAAVLDKEMLSGAVTVSDLKEIGVKNAAVNMKAVGEAIVRSKSGDYPLLTMEAIKSLAQLEVDAKTFAWSASKDEDDGFVSLEARLKICAVHGFDAADGWINLKSYVWKRDAAREAGAEDDKELADYAAYTSKVGAGMGSPKFYEAVDRAMKAGVDPSVVERMKKEGNYNNSETIRLIDAATESIAPSVASGWL